MWYKIGSDNTAKVANFDKHLAISILKVCRMNDKKAQRGMTDTVIPRCGFCRLQIAVRMPKA